MRAWNMPARTKPQFTRWFDWNKKKFNSIKIFDKSTYWKYATFLGLCGSNSQFSESEHVQNLEMIEGKFYDKDTLDLIERPLMTAIAFFQDKIKKTKIEASIEYENLELLMIQRIKKDRKNTRSTDPPRIPKRSEAMRKRYRK
jgi:hypothetical protein